MATSWGIWGVYSWVYFTVVFMFLIDPFPDLLLNSWFWYQYIKLIFVCSTLTSFSVITKCPGTQCKLTLYLSASNHAIPSGIRHLIQLISYLKKNLIYDGQYSSKAEQHSFLVSGRRKVGYFCLFCHDFDGDCFHIAELRTLPPTFSDQFGY